MRSIVWAQAREQVGIPVLLFTSETLAPDRRRRFRFADRADAQSQGNAVTHTARVAAEVDVDPNDLDLFGPEAYLLQVALGGRLLPRKS